MGKNIPSDTYGKDMIKKCPKLFSSFRSFSHSDPLYITVLTHSGLGQVLPTLPFTGSDPVHAKHTFVTTTVAFAAFIEEHF